MNSYFRFSEYMWLILAVLCAALTAYFFFSSQTENGWFGIGMTMLAGVMYGLRRRFNQAQMKRENSKK
ncbi:MAG: hypothetical protein ACRC3B_22080 [Bacteroidia bacterium]